MIIEYEKEKDNEIEKLVKELTNKIGAQQGETRHVYTGSDDRVVSALEKILKLAD
ncbi:MAG: hypothetical protein QW279_04425 [Candidatus Jordarchaeaceae archaeon]